MKWLALLLCFVVGACSPERTNRSADALKKYWSLPSFSLLDQHGNPFRRESMDGRVWVVDFFYSSCPGPCPMLNSRLSKLHKDLEGNPRVGFLSISCDPVKDTPEVLSVYAKKFAADARWLFLTGDKESVYRLALEGFKVSIQQVVGAEEPITHSTKLVLVDTEGWVRGFYEGLEDDANSAIIRDAVELSK